MFFSTCEFACPLLVRDLKRQGSLPSIRTKGLPWSVSIPSATPQALAAYRARQFWTCWCLLTDILTCAISPHLGIHAKDARGQL
jgi:hypothetical protein